MTVAELIERLRAFDGNLPVVGDDYEEGYFPLTEVSARDTMGGVLPDQVVLR
jgi:hypothetical protein